MDSRPRERDFGMPLSDLGKPDQIFLDFFWNSHGRYNYDETDFVKWVVQDVEGSSPTVPDENTADEAQVHFTGKMPDGTVFASTREKNGPMTFKLRQDDGMKGFRLAVSSMKPGEKAIFSIPQRYAQGNSGGPAILEGKNIPPSQILRFDVELICFITDINKDQGILKKIIKSRAAQRHTQPNHLDEVLVNYNAFLEDGTSLSRSAGVEFVIADGFFCPAFADVVKTMGMGEEAVVLITPKYGFGERGRPSVGDDAAVPPDSTLVVNLTLMSWTEVSYIGEKKEILKKRLHKEPQTAKCRPRNQAFVKVRLIGKLQDGTIFDRRGHNGDKPFEFTVDEEQVIYGIDEAVMTMQEGEIATFTIPPQHAFGAVGSDQYKLAIVPPDSVVIYEIELLSVVNDEPWPPMNMTYEVGIEEARSKVEEGDTLFDMGKFLPAYRRYFRARQLLSMTFGEGSIKEMKIYVALKCAECAIHLQRYKQAYERYREVLRYDPNNDQALQMLTKPVPNDTEVIDEAAMHRGLEIPSWVPYVLSLWSGKQKKRNNPMITTIHVPPAAAADQSQGTPSMPVTGSSSATSVSQNKLSSDA